jgi:hypothetical protein
MRVMWADEETGIDFVSLQGLWTIEQYSPTYLRLTNQTTRLIEVTNRVIEFLLFPTTYH